MKKKSMKMIFPVLVFAILFVISISVWAQDTYERVQDEAGVLSQDENKELNQITDDIYDTYQIESIIYIPESSNGKEIRKCAAEFMQEYDYGYGDSKSAFCVIHIPSERNYAVVVRGEAQDDFTEDIQEAFLDIMEPYLKDGDFYKAYRVAEEALERCMKRKIEGNSIRVMDVEDTSYGDIFFESLLLALLPAIAISAIITMAKVRKMKSIRPQSGAKNYMADEGIQLTRKDDIFIRTDVKRVKRPKDDDKGGSSGSFTSGGESFSGSSRNY